MTTRHHVDQGSMTRITSAVTAAGDAGKATAYGTIPNTTAAVDRLVGRLRKLAADRSSSATRQAPGLRRASSANPTRRGLQGSRPLDDRAQERPGGQRQKTDKRDAAGLAELHRGGLLTAVWVPDATHEAMRDLVRARLAAVRAVRASRQAV